MDGSDPPPEEGGIPPDAGAQDVNDDYRLEDQIGHLLRRAHQRATAIFAEHFSEAGLTPTQFAALAKIGDFGEVSQNHLGRATAMDPATCQGVVRRLRERRLVDRGPHASDQRRTLLRLTPAGEALLLRTLANALEVSAATLEPLTSAERKIFLSLLKKLT